MTDSAEHTHANVPAGGLSALRRRQGPSQRVIVDCVAAADAVTIVLMAVVAKWLYIDGYLGSDRDLAPYAVVAAITTAIAHLVFRAQGFYDFDKLAEPRARFLRLAIGLGAAFLVTVGMGFALKISAEFSRIWAGTWFVLSFTSLAASRVATAQILRRWTARGSLARRVAIYGAGPIGKRLAEHIRRHESDIELVGLFDDRQKRTRSTTEPALGLSAGSLDELIDTGRQNAIDQIVVALPLAAEDRILSIVDRLSELPVDIHLCPDLISFKLRSSSVSYLGDIALLDVQQRPMRDWEPLVKAIEDRVIGTVLLALFLPVLALIALAIKLDSTGPVLFRQRRHGFNREVIGVLKFRTMHVAEDGDNVPQAARHDPRVTRVGRFLRRTSLDELPQLINVVRGEMSLVGPRPHALAHNHHYEAILRRYAARHRVKPGITGWAQLNGFRGETETDEKMQARVDYDLHYIENWSLWLDIKILAKTPFHAMVHPSAY